MKKLAIHRLTGKKYLYHDDDGTVEKVKNALQDALRKHHHIVISMKGIDSMTGSFSCEVFMSLHNQHVARIEFVDATTHMLDTLRTEAGFPPNPMEFKISGELKPFDTASVRIYTRMKTSQSWIIWRNYEEPVPYIVKSPDGNNVTTLKRWASRTITQKIASIDVNERFNDWEDYPEHVEEFGCKSAYKRVSKDDELLLVLEVR